MRLRLHHGFVTAMWLAELAAVAVAAAADDPRLAARRLAKETAVENAGVRRALSKEMPPELQALPVFGEIEWTVRELPFVGRGPHAGISGAGMTVADGRLCLAGGFIPAGDETEDAGRRSSRWAQAYDPASDRWTPLPDLPARREYTRAASAGTAVFVLGGAVQGKPTQPGAEVFQIDLARPDAAWRRLPSLSVARTHLSVGVIGDLLIAAGGNRYDAAEKGYSPRTIQNLTERLDLRDVGGGWKKGAPIPGAARGWCATAVVKGRLFLLGGVTWVGASRLRLAESLCYDPVRDAWEKRCAFPVPLSGWGADAYAGRYVLAIGGAARNWNDVPFVYDTQADRWLRIASPLPPGGLFNDPGVCVVGDTVYVAGGEGPGGSHFNHFLIGRIKPADRS